MARSSLVIAFASTVALALELILLPVASSETAIVGGGSAADDEAAAPLACPSLAARMDGAATAVPGATSHLAQPKSPAIASTPDPAPSASASATSPPSLMRWCNSLMMPLTYEAFGAKKSEAPNVQPFLMATYLMRKTFVHQSGHCHFKAAWTLYHLDFAAFGPLKLAHCVSGKSCKKRARADSLFW